MVVGAVMGMGVKIRVRAEAREVLVRGKMMYGFQHMYGSLGAHKT